MKDKLEQAKAYLGTKLCTHKQSTFQYKPELQKGKHHGHGDNRSILAKAERPAH